jgi:hypothetical protein
MWRTRINLCIIFLCALFSPYNEKGEETYESEFEYASEFYIIFERIYNEFDVNFL